MIKRYVESYDFADVKFKTAENYIYSDKGFVIKFSLKSLPKEKCILLNIGECIKITYRPLKKEEENNLTYFEKGEEYFQITDKNEVAPIIEVEIGLSNEINDKWNKMKLGINALMYDMTEKSLYIVYDTVNFRLVYDGKIVNNDMPFGTLNKPKGIYFAHSDYISDISYSNDVGKAKFYRDFEVLDKKLNFYTPYGHNTFIGDVVNFYHNGVYHMMYMPDRHHHGNRWGAGGHHFEHMITRDFIDWEDVGSIWDIEKQWQSTGTGTMFFHKGMYYIAYGLHTDRIIPKDKVISGELRDDFKKNSKTSVFTFDEISKKDKYPSGASYSVSEDGINFEKGEKVFAECENPSIYSDGDKLVMYAGYGSDFDLWYSDEIDKPWRKSAGKSSFKCYENSQMRNSLECPSFFEWNGFKYLIMGFTGFWKADKGSEEYVDCASFGYDVYDGLNVPMAAKTDDNRVILAGWLGGIGWGSMVVHRELIQYDDGMLGMKWLPELFTKLEDKNINLTELEDKKSYYFEADAEWATGENGSVMLIGEDGNGCKLTLDFSDCTAQYCSFGNEKSEQKIEPMYKAIKMYEQNENGTELYGNNLKPDTIPSRSGDFSIANVRYPKESFKVRMLIYYSEKADGTVIDTEIAQSRTLISYRKCFKCKQIKVDNMSNIKLYEAQL